MPFQGGQPGGKGGYGGPNTAGPGGQGRDYNGNAIGSNIPGQFFVGGPAPRIGFGPAPIPVAPPQQGDLYQPGGNRFMPGRGMVPPAGARVGNPRQVMPGQGPMQPGQPGGKGGYGGPRIVGGPAPIGPINNMPFDPRTMPSIGNQGEDFYTSY
jgi:hypothetical protein